MDVRVTEMFIGTVVWLVLMFGSALAVASSGDVADHEIDVDEQESGDAERAQEYFDQGARMYLEEDYAGAVIEFRKAHQLSPHPIFLHNIALSSMHLGRLDDARSAAIEAAEMDEPLPGDSSARNDAIVMGIDTQVTARLVGEQFEALDEPSKEVDEVDDVVVEEEPDDASPADSGGLGAVGWGGVTALGLGASALGGAIYIDGQIRQHRSDLEESGGRLSRQAMERQVDEIHTWQGRGRVLLFSGLGLAVVGGSLLTIDLLSGSSTEADSAVSLVPRVTVGGVDVTMHW